MYNNNDILFKPNWTFDECMLVSNLHTLLLASVS